MTDLKTYAARVEAALDRLLPETHAAFQAGQAPRLLSAAMRYSLLAGGKRLRPSMLLAAVDMLGGDADMAMAPACALEMIHTYSLIHDDLPGMDDDDLRRGRPTCHVAFGEGQAILAGDGLLTHAFEVMLRQALVRPAALNRQVAAMLEIARGAGVAGMVAGQCLDLQADRGEMAGEDLLQYIHRHKTGCLFVAAMAAAGRLCGADDADMAALTGYGRHFGLMFQAADDAMDVTLTAEQMGKHPGKDAADGKLTAVSVWGLRGARDAAARHGAAAIDAIARFGDRAAFFVELAGRHQAV
ncbi:MAG: polyprenyl synthetase family protein [Clostridiales bacterium]|nr:polyprenyl synthetase family protein [Clostridiales bacterium]